MTLRQRVLALREANELILYIRKLEGDQSMNRDVDSIPAILDFLDEAVGVSEKIVKTYEIFDHNNSLTDHGKGILTQAREVLRKWEGK